jgi:hypothetical protein
MFSLFTAEATTALSIVGLSVKETSSCRQQASRAMHRLDRYADYHRESTASEPYMYMGESTHPSATNRPTGARAGVIRTGLDISVVKSL